jgi:tetratricopeptide (TPR) repeat protein
METAMKATLEKAFGYQGDNMNLPVQDLAAALPFEERLIIAARADPISTRIGSAGSFPPETAPTNEIWKQLYARYPDTLLYALQTARGYLNANQFDEGLATVNVISLVPGTADDYDLRQLEASLALGARDYARAQLALDRAAMAATSIGDRPQLGLIRHKQARLALDLGNPAAAASFGLAAKEAGYQAGGNTDDVLAIAFRAIGDYAGARAAIEAGIARDKAQPSYVVLSARLRLASILVDQGALIQARALFGRLMRDGSEGSWTKESTRLALADVLYRRGELSAAQAELDGAGTYHRHRARLLYEQGDLAGAREIVKRSLQILRWDNTGSASQIDWTVGLQARTELASGDTAAARRTIEQVALPHASDKPRRSLQEPERREVFDVAVVRALVALQEAGWGESRAAAETAIALARGDFRADDQAAGECVLALGWLGEGRLIEARAAIARAAPRLRITEDQMLRLSGGIASARVGAAAGTPVSLNQARQDLEALGRQAESIGAVATGFEARLALGEIEVTSAQIAGGRQRLEALAREAKARGFLWIATKATAAAR